MRSLKAETPRVRGLPAENPKGRVPRAEKVRK